MADDISEMVQDWSRVATVEGDFRQEAQLSPRDRAMRRVS